MNRFFAALAMKAKGLPPAIRPEPSVPYGEAWRGANFDAPPPEQTSERDRVDAAGPERESGRGTAALRSDDPIGAPALPRDPPQNERRPKRATDRPAPPTAPAPQIFPARSGLAAPQPLPSHVTDDEEKDFAPASPRAAPATRPGDEAGDRSARSPVPSLARAPEILDRKSTRV